MNGLVGIQRGEICVNLPVIFSDMQAVGTDVVTERKTKSEWIPGEKGTKGPEAVIHREQLGHCYSLSRSLPQILLYLMMRRHTAVHTGRKTTGNKSFETTLFFQQNLLSTCCREDTEALRSNMRFTTALKEVYNMGGGKHNISYNINVNKK